MDGTNEIDAFLQMEQPSIILKFQLIGTASVS